MFFFEINCLALISFFIIICSSIKSAQLGFHVWLPDSMEAPVPASALIHSATLVSAGVFLILRVFPLLETTTILVFILGIWGSFTALYGGLVAAFQIDAKRLLAYSTISHCGFLMVLSSTGYINLVLIYLYVHGFFKAGLFLIVGNVIRFSKNMQDIRYMGGYSKYLPLDCLLSIICAFNLGGLPFSLGGVIKHLLVSILDTTSFVGLLILINCILAAVTGIFYMYRLIFYIYFDIKKS